MQNLETLTLAHQIKGIQDIIKEIDVDYLTKALEEMRANHSKKDAMMVLNPSPFTATHQSDLEAAKLKQLALYLECATNLNTIREAEDKLKTAQANTAEIAKLFI